MADWSGLYHDLLVLIARSIASYEDFIAFGGVCKSWRSAFRQSITRKWASQIPYLMLAEKEGSDLRGFFSLSKGMTRRVSLPKANGKKCFSSQGWLITIEKNRKINLLHPFSQIQKELPGMRTLLYGDLWFSEDDPFLFAKFFDKFALSASPSQTSDYIVMAIYDRFSKLAFCQPRDKSWTIITTFQSLFDVIYHDNKFYTVDLWGRVFACDIEGPNPRLKDPVTALPGELAPLVIEQLYLVESSGALLLVSRNGVQLRPAKEGIDKWIFSDLFPESEEPCLKNSSYRTTGFKVFEVNLGGEEWKELKSLDNRALFLGNNSSISVEASDFSRFKANCVYFTGNFKSYWLIPGGGGRDTGIYNMLDGSIEPHYPGESLSPITPPMWVVPSF